MRLRSIGRLARLLLIAAPPLLIGFLIFRDGVDTPFWDEWDGTAPLFEKMAAGTLGFTDFFAQHNEHRILFPRLIFFGLGRLTHWNIRAELFVSWFLATRLLMLAQARSTLSRKWWTIWILTFFFELLVYFWGYEKPPIHPSLWSPLSHPTPAIEFVLGFLGNPFTFGTNLPPLPLGVGMGGLLVLVLLICAVYLWNKRLDRSLLGDGLPWLMLAMVAVSSAVLTMIGRLGFGPTQVRASRYITFAVMLPIALLALVPVVRSHWTRSFSARGQLTTKAASFLLLSPFILLACPSFLSDLPVWPVIRQMRLYGKALVSFINVVPEPEALARRVFPYDG